MSFITQKELKELAELTVVVHGRVPEVEEAVKELTKADLTQLHPMQRIITNDSRHMDLYDNFAGRGSGDRPGLQYYNRAGERFFLTDHQRDLWEIEYFLLETTEEWKRRIIDVLAEQEIQCNYCAYVREGCEGGIRADGSGSPMYPPCTDMLECFNWEAIEEYLYRVILNSDREVIDAFA